MAIAPDVDLFSPFTLGPLTLPNRIVMAPMTRCRAGTGGVMACMNATYYAQRAGAGLIITEATQVSPQGVGYMGTPGIHSGGQVAGWRMVTDRVHDAGGRILLQLWHVGRVSHPLFQPGGELPVAPSAIAPRGEVLTPRGMQPFVTPRALEAAEMPGIVGQFAQAARLAQAAGFDGVEIHAANGYLLDQFLRDGSNRRDDAWGGSIDNRARLLLEVTAAVTAVWGAERVGIRLSPGSAYNDMRDSDPETTFTRVAGMLDELHPAYLHVVEDGFDPSCLRRVFGGAYIANGGYDAGRARQILRSGAADLVAFGRPFIANPDLPARLAAGAPLAEPDPETFYTGGRSGYIDYPAASAAAGHTPA